MPWISSDSLTKKLRAPNTDSDSESDSAPEARWDGERMCGGEHEECAECEAIVRTWVDLKSEVTAVKAANVTLKAELTAVKKEVGNLFPAAAPNPPAVATPAMRLAGDGQFTAAYWLNEWQKAQDEIAALKADIARLESNKRGKYQ